jgi:hypothetical protein
MILNDFSVVFGGFASDQLSARINHAKPKVSLIFHLLSLLTHTYTHSLSLTLTFTLTLHTSYFTRSLIHIIFILFILQLKYLINDNDNNNIFPIIVMIFVIDFIQVVISASYGIEPTHVVSYKPLLDSAIEMSEHKPQKCIIYQVFILFFIVIVIQIFSL